MCPNPFVSSAGVSVTSSNTGVPDISGSVYTKTQQVRMMLQWYKHWNKCICSETYGKFMTTSVCIKGCMYANKCKNRTLVRTGRPTLLCLSLQQQSFEKQQGFHATTPATSFSQPSALGSGGPINPPAAAGYAPAPFMHILAPHQQPHSQILHHHLQQDGQVRCVCHGACITLYLGEN